MLPHVYDYVMHSCLHTSTCAQTLANRNTEAREAKSCRPSCRFCASHADTLAHALLHCTAHRAVRERWRSRARPGQLLNLATWLSFQSASVPENVPTPNCSGAIWSASAKCWAARRQNTPLKTKARAVRSASGRRRLDQGARLPAHGRLDMPIRSLWRADFCFFACLRKGAQKQLTDLRERSRVQGRRGFD